MDKAGISAAVREKLVAVPGIVKVPADEIDMFILRDFLDERECETVIRMIDANRNPSRLMSDKADPTHRTSETCNLDPTDALVQHIDAKFTAVLGMNSRYSEYIQGQRYAVGQEFKRHYDVLDTGADYWPKQKQIGGQRTWTAMVFLNAPEEGGETYFPRLDLKLKPRRGSLVTWNNLDADGEPNPQTLHQGLPVIAGVKYIITKWYRERPWGARARPEAAS